MILLPWILDLTTTNRVFTSVLAASVWGLAVVLAAARVRTRDARFRRSLGISLLVVAALWTSAWIASFGIAPQAGGNLRGLPRWLMLTHAGLLAAGAGMVILNFVASALWLLQNSLLKKPSWERRKIKLSLPSLEALGKLAAGAVDLALASWGLGFLLAMLNGILTWSKEPMGMAWFKDPKVILAAVLWLWLAVAFQVGYLVSKNSRRLFHFYVLFAVVFLAAFLWTVFVQTGIVHERLKWF